MSYKTQKSALPAFRFNSLSFLVSKYGPEDWSDILQGTKIISDKILTKIQGFSSGKMFFLL